MKAIVHLILFSMLWQFTAAQQAQDTLTIKRVDVIAQRIPNSYKSSTFDSTSIHNSVNLADLLQQHSMVFVKSYGAGSLASVSFRGTGSSHTKVQWNGIDLNSPMNGQIDFSLYPSLFFDEAKLHYGASGLIDGNGALGGSVLLNNQVVYNKGFSTLLQQSLGSFHNYGSAGKVTYSGKKWFTQTQIYSNLNRNDFEYTDISLSDKPQAKQTNAEIKQYGFQQNSYKKLPNGSIGIRFWYFKSDRMLPSSLQVDTNDENQKDESFRTLIELKGLKNNLKYKWVNALISDQIVYNNSLANINSKNNSYLINSKLFTDYYLNHNFILSNTLSIQYENAIADGYSNVHHRTNNTWLLGLTKGYQRLNLALFNRFSQVGNNAQFLAPSLGISYGLFEKKQLTLKANAGTNYNYPTFNDLYWNPGGNVNLQPEYAKMIEFGMSYTQKSPKSTINAEVTGFLSHVSNWIIWQPTVSGLWSPSNIKEVENKGIELSLSLNSVLQKLKVNSAINYSYTISSNLKGQSEFDNSVNKQLIYVPYHQLNYTIQMNYKTYNLGFTYNYTGKRYITTDNNWYLPANFTADLVVGKNMIKSNKYSINVSVKVNNLFSQDYQSIAWRPMPGRNYLGTLTLQFNK